jgi:tetratricopeptide (TPR) repeat protein
MSSESDWAPSDPGEARRAGVVISASSASSGYSDGSSIQSSDLDEFIMSTSQSNALSRQRRKKSRTAKKPKKKTLSTPLSRVSPEVRELIGEGHNAFLKRDYDTAVELLEEAIRLAPGVADPFVTLGTIYDERGDSKRALEAFLVAVHLTPGDTDLWRRVATMSLSSGNLKQAIYCLNRCVRGLPAEEHEPTLRELAGLYMETSRYDKSASILRRLFPVAARDEDLLDIGTSLAKSLYNINEKSESMGVLETLLERSEAAASDANVVNMLCEVFLDLREFGKCFKLLTAVLDVDHLDDPDKCPVDLVAKLALAAAPSWRVHGRILDLASSCVSKCPFPSHSDLYFLMADGLISNGLFDLTLRLLSPAVPADEETRASLQCRLGKCHYNLHDFPRAVDCLSPAVDWLRATNRRVDPETLIMLSDSLRHVGREDESGELLLHSLHYDDLVACRTLPVALPTTQRRRMYDQLESLSRDHPLTDPTAPASMIIPIQSRFATLFLQLVNDCELDIQRIERQKKEAADSTAFRLRKELDLESLEDRIGTDGFVSFLSRGCSVCRLVGRSRECVELLEVILLNKRKRWSQRKEDEKLIKVIESLSFDLSMTARVHKVTIKYIRQSVQENLDNLEIICKLISKISNLMKSFNQREIIEQRSWLVRQACRHPFMFPFVLLAGHLCVYSHNYRFASEEFLRAHHIRPADPWPLLCLGASLLSVAMSRTTRDRHFAVLKAFGVLNEYGVKRLTADPTKRAEVHYNAGRGFHQLSLSTNADREYRLAMSLAAAATGADKTIGRLAAFNLSLIHQRNGLEPQATEILMRNLVAK